MIYFRNNSARELSAFAESAIAVNRVVIQHMSINLNEEQSEHPSDDFNDNDPESNKENLNTELIINAEKIAEKRKIKTYFTVCRGEIYGFEGAAKFVDYLSTRYFCIFLSTP